MIRLQYYLGSSGRLHYGPQPLSLRSGFISLLISLLKLVPELHHLPPGGLMLLLTVLLQRCQLLLQMSCTGKNTRQKEQNLKELPAFSAN